MVFDFCAESGALLNVSKPMEEFTMLNHRVFNLVIAMFLVVSLMSCKDDTPSSTSQLISEVTDVKLALLKSNPPQLSITARGNASTPGWTKPELKPFVYVAPPQDGIYDFNFEAVPPTGPVPAVMTPIEATYILNPLPSTLKGVRIHATNNTREAMLEAM